MPENGLKNSGAFVFPPHLLPGNERYRFANPLVSKLLRSHSPALILNNHDRLRYPRTTETCRQDSVRNNTKAYHYSPNNNKGGNTMGNPLDTISGTITAGFVLTAVLYVLVKALV